MLLLKNLLLVAGFGLFAAAATALPALAASDDNSAWIFAFMIAAALAVTGGLVMAAAFGWDILCNPRWQRRNGQ